MATLHTGESFFHDERRHLDSTLESVEDGAFGVRLINTDREGRYRIVKEVIADPHQPCILLHTRLEADSRLLTKLRLFALLAPHLDVGGWDNSGYVGEAAGRTLLTAERHGIWLAMGRASRSSGAPASGGPVKLAKRSRDDAGRGAGRVDREPRFVGCARSSREKSARRPATSKPTEEEPSWTEGT